MTPVLDAAEATSIAHHGNKQRFRGRERFLFETNDIGGVGSIFVMEAEYLLAAGVGLLVFGELGGGANAVIQFNFDQLVDDAHGGRVG